MANPFTQSTISNYNSNPPPDDNTTGNNNIVEWDKHKTKLSDPIKTAFESSESNTFSAFAKRWYNAISAHTANYTVQ